MTIKTYLDVTFPFDTAFFDGERKVRLLAAFPSEYDRSKVIGYSYYGNDPTTNCSQVLDWDENGVFGSGLHPSMDLVPPPGRTESVRNKLGAEIAEIRQRLADNPDAPEAWRTGDELALASLEKKLAGLAAPHIWERAA